MDLGGGEVIHINYLKKEKEYVEVWKNRCCNINVREKACKKIIETCAMCVCVCVCVHVFSFPLQFHGKGCG
jgi:hypothetical protein